MAPAKGEANLWGTPVLRAISLIGLLLSAYATYAEHQKELDINFVAWCDIGTWASCSKVFASPQGKIFSYFGIIPKGSVLDQPNAFYGCLFYICIILMTTPILPLSLRKPLLLAGTTFGILLSAYLAYVLAFVLRDFCIICVSSYVFNTTAFVIALVNNLSSSSSKTKEG